MTQISLISAAIPFNVSSFLVVAGANTGCSSATKPFHLPICTPKLHHRGELAGCALVLLVQINGASLQQPPSRLIKQSIWSDGAVRFFFWGGDMNLRSVLTSQSDASRQTPDIPVLLSQQLSLRSVSGLTRTRFAFRLIFHLSLNRKTDVLQPCTLGNKPVVMYALLTAS